jgi:gamma-glutamyl:cysteine ligase YbdK (ATP-grasp superfamily)
MRRALRAVADDFRQFAFGVGTNPIALWQARSIVPKPKPGCHESL